MIIKKSNDIRPSEITPEKIYNERRRFLGMAAVSGAAFTGGGLMLTALNALAKPLEAVAFANLKRGPFATDEKQNSFEEITSYNNFYEFGTSKTAPARHAHALTTDPWSVTIEGEAEVTGKFDLDEIIKPHTLEERIYRLRCVEAWSMVIPWVGFPLGDLIKRFKPTSKAKFVEFTTLYRPEEMPGQRVRTLDWPYVEGLRMDEAMHPLTILAVGLYGKVLPNQNGAPLRLVVPWKYGFKSIKSIVKINFRETMPETTWHQTDPGEYGFYSNVNPAVDHPRWSQKRERRIGEFLKRKTLPFNGYADQVAELYKGMDLQKFF